MELYFYVPELLDHLSVLRLQFFDLNVEFVVFSYLFEVVLVCMSEISHNLVVFECHLLIPLLPLLRLLILLLKHHLLLHLQLLALVLKLVNFILDLPNLDLTCLEMLEPFFLVLDALSDLLPTLLEDGVVLGIVNTSLHLIDIRVSQSLSKRLYRVVVGWNSLS